MSLLLAAASACLLCANPSPPPWLPIQRGVVAALMPDFQLLGLDVVATVEAQHKLRARLVNQRPIVMQGQGVPAGADFMAETPQRHGGLLAALTLLAAAIALWRQPAAGRAALFVSLPVAALLLLWAGPVVLAGEVWGLGVPPWSQLSAAAALSGLSHLLLQGGGYVPALLAAWAARQWAARSGRHAAFMAGTRRHQSIAASHHPPHRGTR